MEKEIKRRQVDLELASKGKRTGLGSPSGSDDTLKSCGSAKGMESSLSKKGGASGGSDGSSSMCTLGCGGVGQRIKGSKRECSEVKIKKVTWPTEVAGGGSDGSSSMGTLGSGVVD